MRLPPPSVPIPDGSSPDSRNGGPRTPLGKKQSCQNAIKHGLCAERLLPNVLEPGLVEHYLAQFRKEHGPTGPTEETLVREMARHAAALQLGEQAEGAVLREGARGLAEITPYATRNTDELEDVLLAAAVGTEALDRFARYRRGHEKAFLAALSKLRELRSSSRQTDSSSSSDKPWVFDNERACEEHLRQRFVRTDFRCPHCGANKGYFLRNRLHWECAACQHQVGLRAGTVMAGSRLALTKWFTAIRLLLLKPSVTNVELSQATGINRLATLNAITRKILAALASNEGSELLAGLDFALIKPAKPVEATSRIAKRTTCHSASPNECNSLPGHE
jgi:transposase-like protein